MQRYSHEDPFEREPLDSAREHYESPSRAPIPPAHGYSQPAAQYYDPAPRRNHPSAHPDSAFNRMSVHDDYSQSDRSYSGPDDYDSPRNNAASSQQRNDNAYHSRGGVAGVDQGYARPPPSNTITPGTDNFSESASGGMAGIAYNVADRNPRNSGMEALHNAGQVPPPPSRSHMPQHAYSPQSHGEYGYDGGYGNIAPDQGSHSSSNGLGAPAIPTSSRTPSHFSSDPYVDDPYQGFSTRRGNNLGVVNPNEIEDDGDDGLNYHKQSQRNSMLSLPHSDRGRQAIGTAAAVGGAAGAGGVAGGLLRKGPPGGSEYDLGSGPEKSEWLAKQKNNNKKWKWVIIVLVFLVIVGAIVGGVVGGMMSNNKKKGGSSSQKGQSAADDEKANGDLDKDSDEIKALLDNPDLHMIFPGMDYTPLNTQYPDCIHNPPSQNNVTRDVAVLSQLTNKIRLYGTDCNQTEMVLHAIDKLGLKNDIKVWLGVWQDGNETTNARQLEQMWTILDDYGDKQFEGIIVANEILFRKEMTITELGTILDDVRTNLTKKKLDLPVATSDLGDDWTAALGTDSDYIMANIHPFFAGVEAEQAASWTYSFWENNNKPFWKTDKQKNIISETGWPTAGGKSCGSATTCTNGSVAGIDELNTFMEDWVCDALTNGTNYFWFEAFDEPWKIRFNEKGKEWEDQWGLMTVDRKLKDGVKIPDCGGKTVT
ncbi:Fc.00g035110.m01.CDS01 [Cosmosporella sp. VM-42]